MNSQQAKQLSLPDILSKLGYEAHTINKNGYERWYLSPFRKESKPSFVTSYLGGKWIWNDFGDSGGTVIDFIMRHQNFTKVSQALDFLENFSNLKTYNQPALNLENADLFSSKQQTQFDASSFEKHLEFIRAEPISNSRIIDYLVVKRHIPEKLARKYLVEVTYRNKQSGKEFFAFGIQNQSGGYEIRAATDDFPFKSALNGRDITVIRWHVPESKKVFIFEGMTDFLSLIALKKLENLEGDVVLMHSLSSFKETVSFIQQNQYNEILLFLDNDSSGEKTTEKFKEEFGQLVNPQNEIYLPHKDVNEMLCKQF